MKSKTELGQIVYLITDNEQLPRIVTGIKFSLGGGVVYYLNNGTQESMHYEAEFSENKNIELSLGLDLQYKAD